MHFCSIENKLTIGKQTHTDIRGRDTYSGNFVSIFEYKRPPLLLNVLHLYILQSTKWLRKWQFTRLDWFFKYCLGCNSSIYISIWECPLRMIQKVIWIRQSHWILFWDEHENRNSENYVRHSSIWKKVNPKTQIRATIKVTKVIVDFKRVCVHSQRIQQDK